MTAPVLDATPTTNGQQRPGNGLLETPARRRGQADEVRVKRPRFDALVMEAFAVCDAAIDAGNRIEQDIVAGSFDAAAARAHRLASTTGTSRRELRRLAGIDSTT